MRKTLNLVIILLGDNDENVRTAAVKVIGEISN